MIIPEKVIKKWNVLRSPGDTAKMAEGFPGGYTELFNRAFRTGRCNDNVFQIMARFYEAKAKLIKEYM